MSYQVIARKWRPQTFDEVTGQEPITQTLRNAIEHERLHPAYLFSGARGVGKTTTARLLAKALNCRKSDMPNIHPCRTTDADPCASCVEIAESRSLDVLEIDAASHTGIDNVRDTIIEGINVNPARDRFKIFIIDEVHQLSKPAFNALLKTLEEPPPNVVFIMATTELHKVPDTIASRTQQFEFRTIPLQKIFDRLKLIAKSEKIDVSDDALREMARSGDGSMRDAQSNFDQVISFAGDHIETTDVVNALGLASVDMMTRVINAIAKREAQGVLTVVDELAARGHDFRNFCRDLLGLFRDLLVTKISGDTTLCESSMLPPSELQSRSSAFSESDLARFFHSLADTETRLKEATQPRYVLEVGLVNLVEMRRLAPIESIIERLSDLESRFGDAELPQKAAADLTSSTAFAEKKTLTSDVAAKSSGETAPLPEQIKQRDPVISVPLSKGLDLVNSMPAWVPPIASEELEHIEHPWLDDEYERKLTSTGDDLAPIPAAASWPGIAYGEHVADRPASASAAGRIASGSAATKMALAETTEPTISEPAELPQLSENATPEELVEYAKAHPTVRAALKVFRGKIVGARRISPAG